ncbi:MAG: hypothetical protein WAV13_14300 [Thermodesulfovibrionales bacterium]
MCLCNGPEFLVSDYMFEINAQTKKKNYEFLAELTPPQNEVQKKLIEQIIESNKRIDEHETQVRLLFEKWFK